MIHGSGTDVAPVLINVLQAAIGFVSSVFVPAVNAAVAEPRTPVSLNKLSGKSVRFLFVFAVLNTIGVPAPPSTVQPRAMFNRNLATPVAKAVVFREALRLIERITHIRVTSTQRIWKISALLAKP